jgi:quinol monooxygenase YgiN
MISIVAKFIVNKGEESNFLQLIKPLINASLAEEGCIEYALQKHKKQAETFCLIEKWKDEKAVEIHNKTEHFTSTIPKLVELAKVEVDVYETV